MTLPHLANAELAVMNLLWELDHMTARHIREHLYPDATKAQAPGTGPAKKRVQAARRSAATSPSR